MPSIIDALIAAHDKEQANSSQNSHQNGHNGTQSPKPGQPNGHGPQTRSQEGDLPPRWQRGGKSQAKARRDLERSGATVEEQNEIQQRNRERFQLFGYAVLTNGKVISLDEARRRLSAGVNETRRRESAHAPICPVDILEWHEPETFHDNINSLGEVDALGTYSALGIEPGTVLIDPKIRVPGGHRDPALRR